MEALAEALKDCCGISEMADGEQRAGSRIAGTLDVADSVLKAMVSTSLGLTQPFCGEFVAAPGSTGNSQVHAAEAPAPKSGGLRFSATEFVPRAAATAPHLPPPKGDLVRQQQQQDEMVEPTDLYNMGEASDYWANGKGNHELYADWGSIHSSPDSVEVAADLLQVFAISVMMMSILTSNDNFAWYHGLALLVLAPHKILIL